MKHQVDISFVPTGTRFVSTIPDAATITPPRRLIIASANTADITAAADDWLRLDRSTVEVLWNFRKNTDLAHALINLSETAPLASFRTTNQTAHLQLTRQDRSFPDSSITGLTTDTAQLLEDAHTENIPVPPKTLKQLVWRHFYLLDNTEKLSSKVNHLTQKLENERRFHKEQVDPAGAKERVEQLLLENKTLTEELSHIQQSLSVLQARYTALSTSKLGALTLKYWAMRRKGLQ